LSDEIKAIENQIDEMIPPQYGSRVPLSKEMIEIEIGDTTYNFKYYETSRNIKQKILREKYPGKKFEGCVKLQ